nr:hypothetical protein [Tanacetum cinerariifolium]
MSPGLSAGIAGVAAMSDLAFRKRRRKQEKDKNQNKTRPNQDQMGNVGRPGKCQSPECRKRVLGDKIICDLDKTPDFYQQPHQNCSKCGHPVNGHYCQGCAFLRKKFKKDLFASGIEHGILQDSSEPSNDNSNVVNAPREPFIAELKQNFNGMSIEIRKKEKLQQLEHVSNLSTYPSKRLNFFCYDDDDDEDYNFAITRNKPDNSLSMRDEHPDTIPAIESDEFIKSSVENLVPIPSESEGESECDMPFCEGFTTFSNILFDADYEFDSSDYQSCSHEDVPEKIFSNHLFEEEIIPMKIDQHPIILKEFVGELIHLKSISPGIDETNCDPEEEVRLVERLLYDNSSPRPPEEFVLENSDTEIESFSPSHVPVEDSDSLMEEIDLSFTLDYPMPPGIEDDDYEFERDILILKDLFSNDTLSLSKKEPFHFDIPSFSRPPVKPPDGNTEILNVKMMGDISKQKIHIPKLMITLASN